MCDGDDYFSLPDEVMEKFFSPDATAEEIEETILKALEYYCAKHGGLPL